MEFARLLRLSGQGVTDRRDGTVQVDAKVGRDLLQQAEPVLNDGLHGAFPGGGIGLWLMISPPQ
jgi:hypothetical protein